MRTSLFAPSWDDAFGSSCKREFSYSRSRGLFAGISIEGSTLRQTIKPTPAFYGRKISARSILLENRVAIPKTGRHLVRVLQTNSPGNEPKQVASR